MTGFDSFAVFFQILANGVLLGCMYGVAAIGLSLIFGCMGIVFIAQGSVMILAAYFVYWLFNAIALDPFFAFLLVIPLFMGLGWLIYVGLFQRVSKAGKNPSLLLAFGLMVLLENLMSILWTPNTRAVTTTYSTLGLDVMGVTLSFSRLMVSLVTVGATGLVFLFLKKTMLGQAVRGVSEDARGAALLGISPGKVSAVTFSIGIGLAGIAGVATSISFPFDPYFGFLFSLKALIAVAFGGLGSVGGALLGGIILGVLEVMGSYVISAGWADGVVYTAFLLALIFRPQGLLGRSVEKV